ncbi:MAG: PTS sugar transporter subunit IIA [Candidatus Hydrogenedentes bacterium]|nr:PTS sugar transporter subunit IIA [Candidatus Hydrogenedentota bacterium]
MTDGNRAESFLRIIRRSQRGKLKIYMGYCAGVGKTYRMLQEGRRLKEDGIDVLAGLVETHGRKETEALVEGLNVLPRHPTAYRGITIEEMDLDGILARRPTVVLVDELAHTNVPGSRNAKRYQDVDEILAAGIHVISTLNVQHLESLYETVERATGVKVRERIPDRVIADADQLVNVDVTTEDLRQRLREGRVYTPERIETALENFFQDANLEQLRELTLRELAAHLDSRRRNTAAEAVPFAPDQVMVCLSSRGPNSEALLRYASRFAGRLNRNWYAVYVQTASENPTRIDAGTQRALANTLALAQQLGATVFTYKGDDVVKTILQFAREYRVGHIVIGAPGQAPSPWRRWLGRRSLVDRIITGAEGITVVVRDTRVAPALPALPEDTPAASPEDTGPAQAPHLSTDTPVLIWTEPMEKTLAMRQLLERCLPNELELRQHAWERLLDRERLGGTFVGEDIALPHARIANLSAPRIALGIGKAGVYDAEQDRNARIVILLLSQEEFPNEHVAMLGRICRMACDDTWRREMLSLSDPTAAAACVRGWVAAET